MGFKVLESSEAEGSPFRSRGGRYQIVVKSGGATVNLQIAVPDTDPVEWIDTDEDWSDDGVRAMWLSFEATYRLVPSAAGAEAWLQPVDRLAEF